MSRGLQGKRLRDMAISLAVILLPVLAVMWACTRTPAPSVPSPTALEQTIQQARAESPYPVLVPEGLPAGWSPQRVRWTPQGRPDANGSPSVGSEWVLGYLSPAQVVVAVHQRDVAPEQFVAKVTRDGRRDGQSEVGGRTWERQVSADGRQRALVWRAEKHVTVVTGDTGYADLERFAGALR